MATHDVDRKILSRLARQARGLPLGPDGVPTGELSAALYQILGLSKMLSRRLLRARKLRRLEPYDEKAMTLYHHIIWMSREGLSIVENTVAPIAETNQLGIELKVFAYKLRASFYHVFCLFHNRPSVSPLNPAGDPTDNQAPTVLMPVPGNRQTRVGATTPGDKMTKDPNDPSPPSRTATRGLRDSILSDTSNITNPFGSISGISPPPGLPGRDPSQRPDPAAFLLPSANFIPLAIVSFNTATELAAASLSGSNPLRLSIALEYSAFKWDCLHDHDASRKLAKATIRTVYSAQEGMDDNEFEDAAVLVGTLGRMMRRKSEERTPRFAPESSDSPSTRMTVTPAATAPPVPSVPQITVQEEATLRREAELEERRARAEAEADTRLQTQTRSQAQPQTLPPPPRFKPAVLVTQPEIPPPVLARPPRAPETSTPPRPKTAGSDTNKPLPDLPPADPSFNIPRRPVGTPPSRPRTAENTPGARTAEERMGEEIRRLEAERAAKLARARARTRGMETMRAQASEAEREDTPTQERVTPGRNAFREAGVAREGGRSAKRGFGEVGEGGSGRGSLIPRLRVGGPPSGE